MLQFIDKHRTGGIATLALATCLFAVLTPAHCQEVPPNDSTLEPIDELAYQQSQLADYYKRLEMLIAKMAEVDALNNPGRSALLRQALKRAKDKHIGLQLNVLVKLLTDQKLSRAVEGQSEVATDLENLLELLLSESRPQRLQSEQARVRKYIKDVERLLRQQRGITARTETDRNSEQLGEEQARIADRTGELADTIRTNEESHLQESADNDETDDDANESNDGENKPQEKRDPSNEDENQTDKQSKAQAAGDKNERERSDEDDGNGDTDPSEGQNQSESQGQRGENQGNNSQGNSAESGQQNPAQPPTAGNPARQRVEAAEQRMREARKQLEKAEREQAIERQQEAQTELRKAIAELEEILRQLREEEVERTLAMLEARFRKMLEMQMIVYEGTKQIDKTPANQRTRGDEIEAGKLSASERKVLNEADRALTLLKEEGSSIAFPEVIGQMCDDIEQVIKRLANAKVGSITQEIEEEIIEALEEMIESLRQAQKEMEQRKQQQQQMQQGQDSEQALVDAIAELKMIRSLQIRVNKRTDRYSRLLEDSDEQRGQATNDELINALKNVADREGRIHQITRDIVLGKNR